MKSFKPNDKVKIPITNSSGWDNKLNFIKDLSDYKYDYLIVDTVWKLEEGSDPNDKEIGLLRADGKIFPNDLFNDDDLEIY